MKKIDSQTFAMPQQYALDLTAAAAKYVTDKINPEAYEKLYIILSGMTRDLTRHTGVEKFFNPMDMVADPEHFHAHYTRTGEENPGVHMFMYRENGMLTLTISQVGEIDDGMEGAAKLLWNYHGAVDVTELYFRMELACRDILGRAAPDHFIHDNIVKMSKSDTDYPMLVITDAGIMGLNAEIRACKEQPSLLDLMKSERTPAVYAARREIDDVASPVYDLFIAKEVK